LEEFQNDELRDAFAMHEMEGSACISLHNQAFRIVKPSFECLIFSMVNGDVILLSFDEFQVMMHSFMYIPLHQLYLSVSSFLKLLLCTRVFWVKELFNKSLYCGHSVII
jgi:hypothetical protein